MKASLRSTLIGYAVIVLMAIFPISSVSANGLRTSVSGAGATLATSGTRFAIHIDAETAQLIREWRIAHRLESAGINAPTTSIGALPKDRELNLLEQQCHHDGGSLSMPLVASDEASGTHRQKMLCV